MGEVQTKIKNDDDFNFYLDSLTGIIVEVKNAKHSSEKNSVC